MTELSSRPRTGSHPATQPTDRAGTGSGARSRRVEGLGWPVLAFFAVLPLQWVSVGSTPLGQGRLHQVAILGFAAVIVFRHRARIFTPVLRSAPIFVFANLYMIVGVALAALYVGTSFGNAVEHSLYFGAFIAIGAYFHRVASGADARGLRLLRWAAPVLCASLMAGLALAMLLNGVNPAAVAVRTLASGDPEVFQREVFRSAFAGFGLEDDQVQGNLRHEIFGSVLVSMLVSTWAMRTGPSASPRMTSLYRFAMAAGTILLLLSLSRSVLIAAAVWPALATLRAARRGELSTRQIGILFASLTVLVLLILSGVGSVIANRFLTDTTGYATRASNYGEAFGAIPEYWVTGGFDTAGTSSHNFVIDTLLRSGIVAALAAVVIGMSLLLLFGRLTAGLHRSPSWLVPVLVGLALPLVRMGTSGGGQIPPVEWVSLAFALGVLAAGLRAATSRPGTASRPEPARAEPVRSEPTA